MLGQRLRQAREQRGYTQEQLADRLGIGQQQIHRWEAGKSDPSSQAIADLARTLEVTADYLLGLVESPISRLEEGEFALAPDERRLVQAVRSGNIVQLFQTLARLVTAADNGGTAD
jgi:transcriptional regulator with XRE-family HTH domain